MPLVLRVGVSGMGDLSRARKDLEEILLALLTELLEAFEAVCDEIDAGLGHTSRRELRLVSGLAAGADLVVTRNFLKLSPADQRLKLCFGAIYPDNAQANEAEIEKAQANESFFAENSQVEEFRNIRRQSLFELNLNGGLPKDNGTIRALTRRAQCAYLLKNCDVLLAVSHPGHGGGPGGTLETVHAAQTYQMPTIFVNTDPESNAAPVSVLERFGIFPIRDSGESQHQQPLDLRRLIHEIIAPPSEEAKAGKRLLQLLDKRGNLGNEHLLERLASKTWSILRKRLEATSDKKKKPKPSIPHAKSTFDGSETYGTERLEEIRAKCAKVSRTYASVYRGAFTLVYILAAIAVGLAAVSSLLLFAFARSEGHWLGIGLLFIALLKLTSLIVMARVVKRSKKQLWNERAIHTRYLAERLRHACLLIECFDFQVPFVSISCFATGVRYKGHLDWWLSSLVRGVELRGTVDFDVKTVKRNLAKYIREQRNYHRSTQVSMLRLSSRLERFASRFSVAAIVAVSLDIFVGLIIAPFFEEGIKRYTDFPVFHLVEATLIFVATACPAIIASLNGIRFQSECDRLHERSKDLTQTLGAARRRLNKCVHAFELLDLSEDLNRELGGEVLTWSTLYSRELWEQ